MNRKLKKLLKSNWIVYLLLYPIIWYRRKKAKNKQNLQLQFLNDSSGIVLGGSLVVRLDDYHGDFEIDFRSSILKRILVYRDYESELVTLIKRYIDPKKDVLDVGANVGFHSVLFSKLINNNCKVLSFEPTPTALHYLNNNLKRNECLEKVIVYQGIATNKEGSYILNVIDGLEEYSSIGKLSHPYTRNRESRSLSVKGNTIDNLVKEYKLSPGFIKIDTEGAESFVFKGATETISKYKPVIISELSEKLLREQGQTCSEIFNQLKDADYQIFDAQTLTLVKDVIEGYFIAIFKQK